MNSRSDREATYEVRIRGRLDESWLDWLDAVTIEIDGEEDGQEVTVLTGQFDQAALRGLLTRLWDLNITVLSVGPLNPAMGDHHPSQGRRETVPDHGAADLPTAHGERIEARRD
jgi:hypothetical protein